MAGFITELGYLGFGVTSLAAWRQFGTDILGADVKPGAAAGSLLVKLDDMRSRFIVVEDPADDIAFVGWDVGDAGRLAAYARQLEDLGVAIEWGSPAEHELRGVERMFHFTDPNNIRHEAFAGDRREAQPFSPSKVASGYVTAAGGLGHAVFGSSAYEASLEFAKTVLGARYSDTISQDIGAPRLLTVSFFHINQRHHSIAFADLPGPKKLHHFMLEVGDVRDVGLARDRHIKMGLPIAQDIGQHPNDRMVSYYGVVPSGFLMEFGCGGVMIDDATWEVGHYDRLSDWGHRPLVT